MKRYALPPMRNLRDLGGFPVKDGKSTQFGRVLRGDAPVNLSEEALRTLRDMNITTVIDLRSDDETERMPCSMKTAEGFAYHHIPAQLGANLPQTEDEVPLTYMTIATNLPSMGRILKVIANAPGGVLYHCTAGKDRTGVVSAILLSIAGASREDISADYQISYTYMRPVIEKMLEMYAEMPMALGYSKAEYIEKFLDAFYEKYNTIEAYCQAAGLSDAEMRALAGRLTD